MKGRKKKTGVHMMIMLCICLGCLFLSTGCGGCSKCTNSCGYTCGELACATNGCVCDGCLNCINCTGCLGCIGGCLGLDKQEWLGDE